MFEYKILDNSIKVSVIILTYNPNDTFVESIKMLLCQTVKPYEIIVMNTEEDLFYNNISNDNKLFLENLIDDNTIIVKHIYKSQFDHGKTRNIASSIAKGDYLLYMTDDAVAYNDKLIYNMLKAFDNNNVAISTARQVPKKDASIIEQFVRKFNYPDKSYIRDMNTEKEYGIKNYFVSNVCTMYDKSIFDALLGFKENIPLNEDMLYAYKAIHNNYIIYYNNNAMVYHSHNLSFLNQFKRNYDIAKSQKQNIEIFSNINSVSEGKKLVVFVSKELIKNRKFFSLLLFYVECVFRYFGFLCGKLF